MNDRKPLFLDRDGVLNRNLRPFVGTAEALEIFPWTLDALALLDDAGYDFYVISNQQAVGRGSMGQTDLEAQTVKIDVALASRGLTIRRYYYCTALDEENHPWRKPNCGMIRAAQQDFGIEAAGAFMIGDREGDVEAGARAGCRPLLVLSGGDDGPPWTEWPRKPEQVFPTLYEAAEWIVSADSTASR